MLLTIIAPLVLGALPRMLVSLVAANQASRRSPEESMMAGIMACHPTNDSTLYTAGSGRRCRMERDRRNYQG